MRWHFRWYAMIVWLLSGCGVGLPPVTPTVAPTNTPPPTAIVQQIEPSNTPIIRMTNTATPTDLPSKTPEPQPSATATPLPTDTVPPTPTPLIISTRTPIPPPTATDTPTITPSATASATQTPNAIATANAERLLTRAAASDTPVRATFTPVPQASPTSTLIPPTQDVPPTIITATPNTGILPTPEVAFTPIISTPALEPDAPTVTATPFVPITPSPLPPEQIPPTVEVLVRDNITVLAPTFNNTTTTALTFNVGEGAFFFNGEALPGGGGVRLFEVNPADPNSFARTDANGFLTFRPSNGAETPLNSSPFYAGFSVTSAETNENFVNALSWSPNGQRLAFIVQPAPGTDNVNAGVWFWDANSNSSGTLLHDCPDNGYNSCSLTSRPFGNWQSISVEWSPDSNRVIITAFLPAEGRQAVFISEMNFVTRRPEAPPALRWDNAQWLNNNEILLSGRAPDGASRIAIYDRASNNERVIYDASANGLFLFDAVQRPNGQLIAIGREGGAGDGAYRLYRIENGVATAISAPAGNRPPQRVSWSANYSEAVLTIDGQQWIINANTGTVSRVNVSETVQVGAGLTTEADGASQVQDPPPSGVVAGSRYEAGQQVQFIGDTPRNMRTQPTLAGAFADVINPGDFVTILAGPYEADGYEWWQVANRNGTRAWVSARTLDGFSFFNP
ncbi:MAG: SH3 domain-containing protein [Anaerolineae bacterium]